MSKTRKPAFGRRKAVGRGRESAHQRRPLRAPPEGNRGKYFLGAEERSGDQRQTRFYVTAPCGAINRE
jgi:DNA-directed RNA polymerase subunit M/transcription elongation factor TFIIS